VVAANDFFEQVQDNAFHAGPPASVSARHAEP
jgi:hypothetical protein